MNKCSIFTCINIGNNISMLDLSKIKKKRDNVLDLCKV